MAAFKKNWVTFDAKANLPVLEADELDWKEFNKQHLQVGRPRNFGNYCRSRFHDATVYDGTRVFAVEARDNRIGGIASNVTQLFNTVYFYGKPPNTKRDAHVSAESIPYVVKTENGGGRYFQFCFLPTFQTPELGDGCNAEEFPWPRGVGTVGISRTLAELLEDSRHYFTHPDSLVQFCLGLKIYEPTKQMVAFVRKRTAPGAVTTHLSWAASFGTQPLDESSVTVLRGAGVEELHNEACNEPGRQLVIQQGFIFYALAPDALASTLLGDMAADQSVEVDLYALQEACLEGLAESRVLSLV